MAGQITETKVLIGTTGGQSLEFEAGESDWEHE